MKKHTKESEESIRSCDLKELLVKTTEVVRKVVE